MHDSLLMTPIDIKNLAKILRKTKVVRGLKHFIKQLMCSRTQPSHLKPSMPYFSNINNQIASSVKNLPRITRILTSQHEYINTLKRLLNRKVHLIVESKSS